MRSIAVNLINLYFQNIKKEDKIAMEASSSFSEECSDTVQDNKEQASIENLAHGKIAAGLPIHGHELDGDGEEQERIRKLKAVQDDGCQERVSYQCKHVTGVFLELIT